MMLAQKGAFEYCYHQKRSAVHFGRNQIFAHLNPDAVQKAAQRLNDNYISLAIFKFKEKSYCHFPSLSLAVIHQKTFVKLIKSPIESKKSSLRAVMVFYSVANQSELDPNIFCAVFQVGLNLYFNGSYKGCKGAWCGNSDTFSRMLK